MSTCVRDGWLLAIATLTFALAGCIQEPTEQSDTGWVVESDSSTDASTTDSAGPPTCPEETPVRNPEDCIPRDTGTDADSREQPPECPLGEVYDDDLDGCVDQEDPDIGPVDATDPDTSDTTPSPEVGRQFDGPSLESTSDVPIEDDHGVGLYWQSALSQFGDQALHRYLPDRPVLHLSAITSRGGHVNPTWRLPKKPAESRHFYRNYCEHVGQQECADQGIDDDRPTFALIKVGIHEAPGTGQASDCTYGQIHGKRRCYFGRLIAPSPATMILYAYRKFDTGNYPVFSRLGLSSSEVEQGYNYVLLYPSNPDYEPGFIPFRFDFEDPEMVPFDSTKMFPELYP